ncbi:hypothetical protein [Alteribacillus sp. HJP-4]|uniref:hypothetical protein n=1 Tax=Alteribacillus sp. HJP-4 TaxID=2775394 RepID=UPI0035CD19BA
MMLWIVFTGNTILIASLYIRMAEHRTTQNLPGSHMNIAMTPASLFALCTGLIWTNMYSGFLIETSIATAGIGAASGLMFGSLFHYHYAMSGAMSGVMMGIMAPMLGEMTGRSPLMLIFTQLLFFIFIAKLHQING